MPSGIPLTAAWEFDSTASDFINNTVEAARAGGTAFELLGDTSDYAYFGFSRRIDALLFALTTPGSYGTLTWEYSATVSSWIEFVPVQEFDLDKSIGYMLWAPGFADETEWTSVVLTTSAPHTASTVPDSVSRYYIRVSSQTSVATIATCTTVTCRPYVTYATAADVQRQLQLRTAFSTSTTPSEHRVEDLIRSAEDQLVYQMQRSWRPEFVVDELMDFKPFGMKMRYDDILDFYELAVWDGGSFSAKVVGREGDWHFEPRTGMIYISTIFLDAMPPTMRRSYSVRRGQGAFKRSVRMNYSYGKDIRRDPLGNTLRQIATKMACVDIIGNMDFSPLLPLGLDTVNLQNKIDNFQVDIDNFLSTYAKLSMA